MLFRSHSLDKATCLANSYRNKKINILGYQGLPPSLEKNCEYPTEVDLKKNLAPQKVYKLFLTKNRSTQTIIKGPAFRFKSLFDEYKNKKTTKIQFIDPPIKNSDQR